MSSVSILALFVGFAFVAAGLTGKKLSRLLLGYWDDSAPFVSPSPASPYHPAPAPQAPPGWVTPADPNRGGGVYTSYTPGSDGAFTPGNLTDLAAVLPELV